ncbi:TPA: hypothetical protein ACGVDH_002136 [Enterococcus faecium]|uniref:hypothetical protein n=1 Tax=Enterococcus lactis TaxID=357441 RepID=UPI001BD0410C|nr:hypothetical protein [Enterococcus lactis]HCD9038592.1 hypothetical protein [Enterococcus faecium]
MIIELFGLPGSGKSYLTNKLIDELNSEGIQAVNVTEYLNGTIKGRITKKILLNSFYINFPLKRIRNDIINLVPKKNSWKSNFGIYDTSDFTLNTIAMILYLQMKMNDNKVYILDEGAMHTIVKMAGDFDLSFEEVSDLSTYVLKKLRSNEGLIIYNSASVEKSIESIKSRNRHVCTFDELPDHKLLSILNKYNAVCKSISNSYNVLEIERSTLLMENIKKITNIIKSRN